LCPLLARLLPGQGDRTGQDSSGPLGSPSTHLSPHHETIGLKKNHVHNMAAFKVKEPQAVSGNSVLYLLFSSANVG